MARERTGTLIPRLDKHGNIISYGAKVRVETDGVKSRPTIDLFTKDPILARKRLAKFVADVAAGKVVQAAREEISACETVAKYRVTFIERRRALGVGMVPSEEINFDKHIVPILGTYAVDAVTRTHVKAVLDAAAIKGLSRGTVAHVRALLVRFFNAAIDDGIIPSEVNPAARAALPPMREVRKERAILTDGEVVAFLSAPTRDLEMKMLSLVARAEGGLRTAEVNRWAWEMIDRVRFELCTIPRAKGGVPQAIEIPEVLRAPLRGWWERQKRPETGPVFPVTRGRRKGETKGKQVSYAKRLRRELLRAGVKRHECSRPTDAPVVKRDELCCEACKRDPLYTETAYSLPVDFHSFRRAFVSALAGAGVNAQHAMRLTGHTDATTHNRYLMNTPAMQAIPAGALPQLPRLVRVRTNESGSLTAPLFFERETGLEPATLSLGS